MKIKEYIFPTLFVITMVFTMFALATIGEQSREMNMNSYNEKCNNIDLEYLSVTKQVFGDDYIVCYNNSTKQTEQIPI